MTFEEALIEHCSPTLAGVSPPACSASVPGQPFSRRFLALRQQFAARGLRLVISRLPPLALPALYRERDLAEVLGRRAPGFSARYGLQSRGRRPATACGSWPPACLEENSPRDRRLLGVSSG